MSHLPASYVPLMYVLVASSLSLPVISTVPVVLPVPVNKTLLLCEPLPFNPEEATPVLPLIWCSDSLFSHVSSPPEEFFFTDTDSATVTVISISNSTSISIRISTSVSIGISVCISASVNIITSTSTRYTVHV